jgi:hypothetical protein
MKKVLIVSLAVFLFYANAASAIVLQLGLPIEKGKWTISGLAYQENDNTLNINTLFYGPSVNYGIIDQLYFTGVFVMGSLSGSGLGGATGTVPAGYQVGLTYNLLNENRNAPVSLNAGVLYSGSQVKVEAGGVTISTTDYTEPDLELIVSKMFLPLIPYAAIKYGSMNAVTAGAATTSAITELALGTGVFFNPTYGVLLEYNMKTAASGGASTSLPGIGINVIYNL